MIVHHPQVEVSGQAQLEDYLDHVLAPLVGTVPYNRRKELRAELTAHLEALVEARTELGETREQAITAALRQFGNPAVIGGEWLGEWRPKSGFPLRTTRLAMAYFLPASLLALFVINVLSPVQTPPAAFFVLTVIPTVTGFLVGLLARNRPAAGTLFGVLGLALITGLLGLIEVFVLGRLEQPVPMPLSGIAAIQLCIWAPLGSIAAIAGGVIRRKVLDTVRAVGTV